METHQQPPSYSVDIDLTHLEKPPPYDFGTNEDSGSIDSSDSSPQEAPQVVTLPFSPFGWVWIPARVRRDHSDGENEESLVFLIVMTAVLFPCGGFLTLLFLLKAWRAKATGKKGLAKKFLTWGKRLSGIPLIVLFLALIITIIAVGATSTKLP